jgi:hypothetical protein
MRGKQWLIVARKLPDDSTLEDYATPADLAAAGYVPIDVAADEHCARMEMSRELHSHEDEIARLTSELRAVKKERDRLASWRTEVLISRKVYNPPPGNELHAAVAVAEAGYRASQPTDSIAEGAREGMGG